MRFVFPYTSRIGAARKKPTVVLEISRHRQRRPGLRVVAIADTGSARIVLRDDLAMVLGIALDSLAPWSGRSPDGHLVHGHVARVRIVLDDRSGSRGEWSPEVVFAPVKRNLFGFQEGQEYFDCHFYNRRLELVLDLLGGAPVRT